MEPCYAPAEENTEWQRRVKANLLERGWKEIANPWHKNRERMMTKCFPSAGQGHAEYDKASIEAIRP